MYIGNKLDKLKRKTQYYIRCDWNVTIENKRIVKLWSIMLSFATTRRTYAKRRNERRLRLRDKGKSSWSGADFAALSNVRNSLPMPHPIFSNSCPIKLKQKEIFNRNNSNERWSSRRRQRWWRRWRQRHDEEEEDSAIDEIFRDCYVPINAYERIRTNSDGRSRSELPELSTLAVDPRRRRHHRHRCCRHRHCCYRITQCDAS